MCVCVRKGGSPSQECGRYVQKKQLKEEAGRLETQTPVRIQGREDQQLGWRKGPRFANKLSLSLQAVPAEASQPELPPQGKPAALAQSLEGDLGLTDTKLELFALLSEAVPAKGTRGIVPSPESSGADAPPGSPTCRSHTTFLKWIDLVCPGPARMTSTGETRAVGHRPLQSAEPQRLRASCPACHKTLG